ncbi:hypothetical protein [Parafilimonas sp.]|uniref:hypothetical protein n=1 Tax=Parafilimonas sp. TaxID=1969739 RepID=UPI003F7DC0ED
MSWQPNNFYFSRLRKDELKDLVSFVVLEIYEHFNYKDYTQQSFENEFEYLLKEDLAFFGNSVYYVLRNHFDHKIYGSIKTTYWDRAATIPMEKLFGINVQDVLIPDYLNIWHLGRFVISGKICEERIGILKKMLFNAFYPISTMGAGLVLAECDKKLTMTLKKMGIDSFVLGDSIEYICSETLPIYIKSDWLNQYISSNSQRYLDKENSQDFQFFLKKINSNVEVNTDANF